MRAALILLLLAAASPAFAVRLSSRPPDPGVVAKIQEELDQVKDLKESKHGINELERELRLETNKGSKADRTTIAMLEANLKPLKAQRNALCNRIIKEVRTAYGIEPDHWAGKLVTPEFVGHMTHWDPKFDDEELKKDPKTGKLVVTRDVLNGWGETVHLDGTPSPFRKNGAQTWDDGYIGITPGAFEHSPGILAAIIAHETVHFEQNITHGRADRLLNHPDQIEQEAFKVMKDNADTVFMLTENEKEMVKAAETAEVTWRQRNPHPFALRGRLDHPDEGEPIDNDDPEAAKSGADSDFLQSAAQLAQISQDAVATFEDQERQRRAEEIRRAEEDKRKKQEFEARSVSAEKLKEAARRCDFEYNDLPDRDEISVRVGYKGKHWNMKYQFVVGKDMDQVKMGIAFLRKCLEAALLDKPDDPLCIDDASRLDARWSDPGFREGASMVNETANSDEVGPNECMKSLRSELKAPLDPKQISKIASKAGKNWRKEHEKAADEWNRYRNPPSRPPMHNPDPDPPRRGGGGTPGGGGGGESPAQRFCESRGCTSAGPGRCTCPVAPL